MTEKRKTIYCCECKKDVCARLTNGREVYPHREDLFDLPFWMCDTCMNFVGCHHKTANRTAPLGCIPNPEVRAARKHLHALIDPIWKSGKMTRRRIYESISCDVGWSYHTAKLRSIEEARDVYRSVMRILRGMQMNVQRTEEA